MATKIRLKRLGKIRAPYYRIVVADSRTKRDGRVIEEIGKYHPTEEPSFIEVDSERAQYWLSVGAQPTEQVAAILKITGDWGKFKGDKDAKSTVQVAEAKAAFVADESISNSGLASAVRTVETAFLSPLKVPQSPVSLRSAVTCSVGCAPTPSQYCARSESISMTDGSWVGWYLPISSIERPSRLVRESATTTR